MHIREANPFSDSHRVAYLDAIQILVGFVTILLNMLLLVSNWLRKGSRWSTDSLLITLTALLDCVIEVYFVVGTGFRVSDPSLVYDSSPWCITNFMMGRTASIACLDMVALLALVRYLVIVHRHPPRPWLWGSIAIFVLISCFVVAFLRASTDKLHVFPSRIYCAPTHKEDAAHYKILVHLTVWLSFPPVLIIPFCYIALTVTYARQVYNAYGGEFPNYGRPRRRVVGMSLIVLGYFVAILPEYILLIQFRVYGSVPSPFFDGMAATSFNFVSIINAIFPLLFHEEIDPVDVQSSSDQDLIPKNLC